MSAPLAIIAGIPLGLYQRVRDKPARAGWKIQVLPSQHHRRADLASIWQRVMAATAAGPELGVHLLLAHDREDERPGFAELKSKSLRAAWLSRAQAARYGRQDFQDSVDDILQFEENWRDRVRPTMSSPLLLPETVFSATQSVADAWTRARRVGIGRDNLEAVENTIERFRASHRRRDEWHDEKALVFSTGPRHGQHGLPDWRRRKLTRRLPDGFHFDVRHRHGQSFQIACQHGDIRRIRGYANIDAHGFVR